MKKPLFSFASLLLFSLLVSIHFLAETFYLYQEFVWFDLFVHMLGGAWVALFSNMIVFFSPFAQYTIPPTTVSITFVAVSMAICIGGMWEFIEILLGRTMATNIIFDTTLDMLMNILGALCSSWYIVRRITGNI